MIIKSIIAAIAAFGFGILFNIKGNKLIFAALGGGLGWFVYSLCLYLSFSNLSALFFSSICFSIYSEIFARILKTPITTLVICALIPLVPGAGMYNAMYEVITGDVLKALQIALNTMASAGILALGIILVSTITRQIYSIKAK